mgnify:CR=1 FL=1
MTKETLNMSEIKEGKMQQSRRDEVVVEPTEGWVSVSSPVREKESEEVEKGCIVSTCTWFSSGDSLGSSKGG